MNLYLMTCYLFYENFLLNDGLLHLFFLSSHLRVIFYSYFIPGIEFTTLISKLLTLLLAACKGHTLLLSELKFKRFWWLIQQICLLHFRDPRRFKILEMISMHHDAIETTMITVTVGYFPFLLTVGSSCRDTELTVVRSTTIFHYLITMQNLTLSGSSQMIDFALRFASLRVFPVIPIKVNYRFVFFVAQQDPWAQINYKRPTQMYGVSEILVVIQWRFLPASMKLVSKDVSIGELYRLKQWGL